MLLDTLLPQDRSLPPGASNEARLDQGDEDGLIHRVRPLDEGLLELLVLGRASSPSRNWPVDLARSLAWHGQSLVEGHVVRTDCWTAQLVIDPGREVVDDYARLLQSKPGLDWCPPESRLIDYELWRVGRADDRIHLEVHAWDGLGLLASVMSRVASYGLLVEELLLETEGECAFHRLVLTDDARAPRATGSLSARVARLDRDLSKLRD